MNDIHTDEKPFRVGTYSTVAEADRVVRDLLAAGFTKDEIVIVCSDEHKERHFSHLRTERPATEFVPEAILTGGAIGAVVGGITLAATTLATGGLFLVPGSIILLGGGALGGSFVGAMATRGTEREIVDYYEQALHQGDILVAVESPGEHDPHRLAKAESILGGRGAETTALVEG